MQNIRTQAGVEVYIIDRWAEVIHPQTKQQRTIHHLKIPLLGEFCCNDRALKVMTDDPAKDIMGRVWTQESLTVHLNRLGA